MQKFPTLFQRTDKGRALDSINPDAAWILSEPSIPSEKFDGSACLVRDGILWRRHQLREGKPRPEGWIHWTFNPDQASGHGWLQVTYSPIDQYHMFAWNLDSERLDGTYELVGPSVQSNPYTLYRHELWRHGADRGVIQDWPLFDFNAIGSWLAAHEVEGIVWRSIADPTRSVKIKRRDFGLPWPPRR